MLIVHYSKQFTKDYALMLKRGLDLNKLDYIIHVLSEKERLPVKYRSHRLTGNYKGFKECHISPDWLLIYSIENNILYLSRTGTHSDLF